MANDPDDLVIRILREIQGTLADHTQRFDRTDESLQQIDRRLEEVNQGMIHRSAWQDILMSDRTGFRRNSPT